MKKKLLILSVALFVLLVSAEAYNNSLITLSMDEIKSGEVSYTGVGGGPRHELSYSELKEFVDFFNSCNIKKTDRRKISGNHSSISDSTDLSLLMQNDRNIYYMAFWDGEIYVTDEYNNMYYSLYNEKLLNYIKDMSKYFDW
mgnify:CR=1 FL=1